MLFRHSDKSAVFVFGGDMKIVPEVSKILRTIKNNVPSGSKLVLACSGGTDSMALLDAVLLLRVQLEYTAYVCHVEHGIRGEEALRDAAFVQKFCSEQQVEYRCCHVAAVQYAAEQKMSLEAAARSLRYQQLDNYATEVQADYILTAHHEDDQAETVLLRLFRGSGLTGLASMQRLNGILLRPFLKVQRVEIEAYCSARGLGFCLDSTNEDLSYQRNRIRKVLLPLLKKDYNSDIIKVLANTADVLREDDACLEALAAECFREHVHTQVLSTVIERSYLMSLPSALQRRVARKMWKQVAQGGELGFVHIKAMLELCSSGVSGKSVILPGGVIAKYAYGSLTIVYKEKIAHESANKQSFVSQALELTDIQNQAIRINLSETQSLELCYTSDRRFAGFEYYYPWQLLHGPLIIGNRRGGEYFFPAGGVGKKKLKDYLIDKKIPQAERDGLLLVTDQSDVLMIIGHKSAGWVQTQMNGDGPWLVMRIIDNNFFRGHCDEA